MKRQKKLFSMIPLRPRRSRLAVDAYANAMQKLDSRAAGQLLASELLRRLRANRKANREDIAQQEDGARIMISLARAAHLAGKITEPECAFHCILRVTYIHEDRWLDGVYQELDRISASMDSIEKQYGLSDEEAWPAGKGPPEHRKLEREYNRVLERNEVATLREFGLDDFADLVEEDRKKFRALFERGARAAFDKDAVEPALRDLLPSFVDEAERAGEAGAYVAGCACYGAAMETLLLIRCLHSPNKSYANAKKVSRRKLKRDPLTWTLEILIDTCESAGWLPSVESSLCLHSRAGLAHYLRRLRNLVHPARMVRDRGWALVGREDYTTAKAVYQVLEAAFRKKRERDTPVHPQNRRGQTAKSFKSQADYI